MPVARANPAPGAAPSSATLRQQVYAQLRSAIEQGRWPAGTRLPPSRTHAGLLGVSRNTVLWAVQRLLAEDCVHAFLYQPLWTTIANKNVKGLWKDMPIFVNDIGSLSWS